MKLFINETLETLNETEVSINFIKERFKKNADVVILNGYPISENKFLKDGDRVTLIKKGENPTFEELESLMVARHTPNIHSSLKKGKVVVLGLGGLGSNIAISLARIGVGHLILADFDVVEPSNLNRQQYFISDIGKYKTDAIKNHIKNINPFIKIDTVNKIIDSSNINEFEDVDIIMEAFDNPRYKAEIASFVLKNMKNKYLISSSGMAGFYDSNIIKTRKIKDKFFICGDEVSEAKEGDGLMAPRVSICANHMANLATKILIEYIK
ncbi:sulfur carrier protein ThiS adenylyltransferase ThiF [Paraclostridium dentum]|uniref:sulfur carrier protein ThiS adenylyltransferase ThiF n=1 Tax=Paraclostridium dentum TaxID=2662455 RepID=UPI003B0036C4